MDICEFKDNVWDYTRKISENANSVFAPVCEMHGLTMMQARILRELHRQKLHTIGSLAKRIYVAEANVSAMCKKLENSGLLHRYRDRKDERVVKVRLSQEGWQLATAVELSMDDRFQCIFQEAEDSFEDIIKGLESLNELLQKIPRAR